ncbi:helix-turn-helix transcriptional regulator [Acinetobacter defluvii]|uniref:helix-turn-helix transcriptional regulator n=1 Tax=Acinetobacter defluvii TaxID=1871111 RepID=UPI003AF43A42
MSEKQQRNVQLCDRLANILTKLSLGQSLSYKELKDEFNVTERTIRRDIDRLSAANLPILKDENTNKFFLQTYYVGKITPKDIKSFAQLSGIAGLYPNLDISFIRELLDKHASEVYTAKGNSFEETSQYEDLFKSISNAIKNKRIFQFVYNDKLRRVAPYKLVHHHGSWYLAAVQEHQLRAFKLNRINDYKKVLDLDEFTLDPVIVKQLENEESIWFGNEKKQILLKVNAEIAEHIQQRQIFPKQKIEQVFENGDLLVSSRIAHNDQIKSSIRFWMPHVRVQDPIELQHEIEEDLKRYLGE